MIKCNLMLNAQLSSNCNNQKRDLCRKKQQQQLFMLQVMVKETPDQGIIPQCKLSNENYLYLLCSLTYMERVVLYISTRNKFKT